MPSDVVSVTSCRQVSALFHIASTKEPPAIPEVLSKEGRDFLLQCFNRSTSPLRPHSALTIKGKEQNFPTMESSTMEPWHAHFCMVLLCSTSIWQLGHSSGPQGNALDGYDQSFRVIQMGTERGTDTEC
jgi:hypothetical protein